MKLHHKAKTSRKGYILTIIGLVILTIVAIGGYGLFQEGKIKAITDASHAQAAAADARIAAIEAKKKEPVYITLPGAQPFRAIVQDYDQPDSLWAMANKQRALPYNYKPTLVYANVPIGVTRVDNQGSVRDDVAGPLETLFAAAAKDGGSLMISSAFRSADLQSSLYNGYIATQGLSFAMQYSAIPGHSEHQLGLSVDISTSSQECTLSECFTSTRDGLWLAENAYKYGFALRYLKGKESITGYAFEPWHYRYVGVDLATALHESGLTLEEAWPYLMTARDTLKTNRAL
jgi:D-alanyl-D-alanine carboxypeptidase